MCQLFAQAHSRVLTFSCPYFLSVDGAMGDRVFESGSPGSFLKQDSSSSLEVMSGWKGLEGQVCLLFLKCLLAVAVIVHLCFPKNGFALHLSFSSRLPRIRDLFLCFPYISLVEEQQERFCAVQGLILPAQGLTPRCTDQWRHLARA